jgi:ATP-dependent Clp protease ATP-binding subunit ClpC
MLERFTDDARQVLVFASEEARSLAHDWLGTEHILLGLLRGADTTAAEVLAALDVRIEPVRAEVTRIIGDRTAAKPVDGQTPFTPRAKRVLELALREALALGHNEVDTEHLLLGLARENQGVANGVLDGLGADAQRIRTETLSRRPSARAASPAQHPPMGTAVAGAAPPDGDGRRRRAGSTASSGPSRACTCPPTRSTHWARKGGSSSQPCPRSSARASSSSGSCGFRDDRSCRRTPVPKRTR